MNSNDLGEPNFSLEHRCQTGIIKYMSFRNDSDRASFGHGMPSGSPLVH